MHACTSRSKFFRGNRQMVPKRVRPPQIVYRLRYKLVNHEMLSMFVPTPSESSTHSLQNPIQKKSTPRKFETNKYNSCGCDHTSPTPFFNGNLYDTKNYSFFFSFFFSFKNNCVLFFFLKIYIFI